MSKLAKFILFADDTNIFFAGKDMINGVFAKLAKWFVCEHIIIEPVKNKLCYSGTVRPILKLICSLITNNESTCNEMSKCIY